MHSAATKPIAETGGKPGYIHSHRQMTLPSASRLLSRFVEPVTSLYMTADSATTKAVHSAKGSWTLTVSHRLHGKHRHCDLM